MPARLPVRDIAVYVKRFFALRLVDYGQPRRLTLAIMIVFVAPPVPRRVASMVLC